MKQKILLLVPILLILGFGLYRLNMLKAASVASASGRFNIAAYNPTVGIWILAVDKEAITGVFIPQDVYIETARGGGKYAVGNLGKLAKLAGAISSYLKESIIRFLHVPVDGVIISRRIRTVEDIRKAVRFADLGVYDRIVLWWRLRGALLAKGRIINLARTRAVVTVKQPDGLRIREAKAELFPIELHQLFVEPAIASEKQQLVVVNTTRTPSLAQLVADIAENIGLDVVRLANTDTAVDECNLRSRSGARSSLGFQRLTAVFGCKAVREQPRYSAADFELYIGTDFSDKMFGK